MLEEFEERRVELERGRWEALHDSPEKNAARRLSCHMHRLEENDAIDGEVVPHPTRCQHP